jgi:MFS family permease
VATSTFRSLRHRNARLYFLGLIVSNAGTWLQSTAQAWLVLKLSDSGTALGIVIACQFLPMLLLGPWAGVLADRRNKRRLVFATQAAAGVQALLLGFLDLTGHVSLPVVYVLALALGVISAIDNPSRRSFISELVAPDELPNAMSLNTAVMTGSRVVGPAIAGLMIAAVGTGWCFVVNGITFVAVLLALVAMDGAQIHRATPTPRAKGQVREGMRYAWANRTLRVSFVVLIVVSTIAFNYSVTIPMLVRSVFAGGPGIFGALLAVTSVGSLVGSLFTASRHHVGVPYLLASVFVLSGFMTAMAFSPTLWLAFALSVPMGAGGAAFISASSGIVLTHSQPEMRGRLLALQATAFLGSTPIGSPFVGWFGDEFGARWGLAIGGLLSLALLAGVLAVLRRRPLPLDEPFDAPLRVSPDVTLAD